MTWYSVQGGAGIKIPDQLVGRFGHPATNFFWHTIFFSTRFAQNDPEITSWMHHLEGKGTCIEAKNESSDKIRHGRAKYEIKCYQIGSLWVWLWASGTHICRRCEGMWDNLGEFSPILKVDFILHFILISFGMCQAWWGGQEIDLHSLQVSGGKGAHHWHYIS